MAMTERDFEDLDRWGAMFTDEEPPRELIRLADIVRQRISPTKPVAEVAYDLLDELSSPDAPPLDIFLLRRGRRAFQVQPLDAWQLPLRLNQTYILRGVREPGDDEWRVVPAAVAHIAGPAMRRVTGHQGLLHCLRISWAYRAERAADLDEGLAGRVAILKCDAHLLLPMSVPTSASTSVPIKPGKAPGAIWTAEIHRVLLLQHRALMKANPKLGIEAADRELANVWSLSASAIKQHRLIAEHEDRDTSAEGDAGSRCRAA